MEKIILIEDRNLYDGWSVRYNYETDEFTWRENAWWLKDLSISFKEEWEAKHRESLRAQEERFND